MTRIAFTAPMKPPDHPRPSGDRLIARLTLEALKRAGFEPVIASRLRTLDTDGREEAQARLIVEADEEARQIARALAADPPVAWFTYHSHYKAPDLVGRRVAKRLSLPYLISEPSHSPKRLNGPWAGFARENAAALDAADRLLWTTPRDRPELEQAGWGAKLVRLPAFLNLGPPVAPRASRTPLRLLTVAMMRPGAKAESYRRLAAALSLVETDWRLDVIGDGAARAEIETAFAPVVSQVTLHGAIDDPARIRKAMEAADLFVWPGVEEGVGMTWLEAQAAALPVVAEDGPAARAVIGGGRLAPPDDPTAFATAIVDAAAARTGLSAQARAHAEAHHGLDAAARSLRQILETLRLETREAAP